MNRLYLTGEECDSIRALLNDLKTRYRSVEDPHFLRYASAFAHELPRRVRVFLNDFKLSECAPGICLISGYPINDRKIGKTPAHWKDKPEDSPTLDEELLIALFGSLLGDLFGWATEQVGRIVHEVFPIKENENKQISTSSEQTIWWHTEDAFHAYSADYLGLFCLRNPDGVATTYASIDMVELPPEQVRILFEPRFVIRPDISHQESNGDQANGHAGAVEAARLMIRQMNERPQKVPVLFGNPQSPYLRIDPYFMDPPLGDEEAQQALAKLIKSVDEVLTSLVLQPGDCCFIDNLRTVHGRMPFKARYDGTDRWLKRINVTKDLRKSRSARLECSSRIIY